MKITIYELLGLIKDGKAPKKIKFRNEIYEYENHIKNGFIDYVGIEKEDNEAFYLSSYIGNNYISDIFTDEVEIIEEPKKIEKLKIEQDTQNSNYYIKNEYGTKCGLTKHSKMIAEKVNELIDEINNLKEE